MRRTPPYACFIYNHLEIKNLNEPKTQFREVYFDNIRELDIFRIYEKPGEIYCNQIFYDFCKDYQLTNILEWMEEVKF